MSDDNINHPSHYTQGGIESIDVIEAKGHGVGFCYGNAIKYLMRAPFKGSEVEDLKKARWYINRLIAAADKHAPDKQLHRWQYGACVVCGIGGTDENRHAVCPGSGLSPGDGF